MKHLLLAALLLSVFTGCRKKEDPAPDPFLGHWQSESNTAFVLDAQGNATSPVITNYNATSLDVTDTTISFQSDATGQVLTFRYTRNGENLLYTNYASSITRYYVRALTATSCTIESIYPGTDGNMYVSREPFHR
jgi:hypothetical protein